MSATRTRTARIMVIACLLSGSAAIGAEDERRQSDDTSASEPLFYHSFAGANAADVTVPEALVSDNIIVVYQHRFGIHPSISREGKVINGGVPQSINIPAHLRKLARDIEEQIPDPKYDGYVVIDYEGWRPFWDDTAGNYRELSRELLRAKHPNWDEAKIERKARLGFNAGAKKFLSRTLDKCRAMRPDAKWGLFSYPKANFRNNRADWLWDRHDAFFPGIYMTYSLVADDVEPGLGEQREKDFIRNRLVARVEYARELAGDRPVLPFMWPRYTKRNPNQWLRYRPLKQSDLAMSLEGPLRHGADGVVIWENLPQPGLAAVFQDQIDESIAPEVRRILISRGLPTDEGVVGEESSSPGESTDYGPPPSNVDTDQLVEAETKPTKARKGKGKRRWTRRDG